MVIDGVGEEMSKKYKITVLPGDGIGKEVTDAAMKVLDAVGFSELADYAWGDIGWEFWCNTRKNNRTLETV